MGNKSQLQILPNPNHFQKRKIPPLNISLAKLSLHFFFLEKRKPVLKENYFFW